MNKIKAFHDTLYEIWDKMCYSNTPTTCYESWERYFTWPTYFIFWLMNLWSPYLNVNIETFKNILYQVRILQLISIVHFCVCWRLLRASVVPLFLYYNWCFPRFWFVTRICFRLIDVWLLNSGMLLILYVW